MKKILSFSFIFIFIIVHSFAQLKRANKYYDSYNYAKAIDLYKKVLRKDDNTEALQKLANSYRLTKNYKQAEIYYARLVQKEGIDPLGFFYYGSVLKSNGKIDEAKEQFKKYSSLVPDDKKTEAHFRSLEDIKIWISRAQQYEIKSAPVLNTVNAEFCPVLYKDKIIYASSKKKDMVNNSKDAWDDQPFLSVISTPFKKTENGDLVFSKGTNSLPWPINTDYHDGPVCFNPEQNIAFVTRVDYKVNKKDKTFVNRPKLYIFELKGSKWVLRAPFPYNNDTYSVLHPSISADGMLLYFASDMPGGNGGTDLYVCRKEGESWSKPENLGKTVNSSGNEVFPYIRKDGVLFFSSDGHPGFGGLDVFSCLKSGGEFLEPKNQGSPFNSSTDDFGVLFLDDNQKGFLSSDRPGGKGSDDIYSFTAMNKMIAVTGKILLSKDINDPAKNVQVNLLTADGNVITMTTTDSTGFFKFENLDPDNNYMVKLNEEDPNLKKNNKYYMADQNGKIVRVTVINDKGGKFVFTNLPSDPNSLPQIGVEEVNLAGSLLYGEDPSRPMPNTKVNLVNEKGEVIQTVTTNELGAFIFTNLPPDQNFFVKVEEVDTDLAPGTKIIVTNTLGKEVYSTKTDKNGGFKFEFLATDVHTLEMLQVEDSELRFDFIAFLVSEKKDPLANTTINLVNEEGEVLRSIKTDKSGGFLFTNLPADKDLMFSVDEKDTKMKEYQKLYLVDAKGKIIKEIGRSNGVFRFKVLPIEENALGVVHAEDPALKDAIQYEWKAFLADDNKKPLPKTMIRLVGPDSEILQSIKTDEKGSFFFTNLPSDKNLLFAVDESDEKVKSLKILYILDEKGNVLKEIIKSGGRFVFTVLPNEEKKLGLVYTEDTQLAIQRKNALQVTGQNILFEWTAYVLDENKVPIPKAGLSFLNSANQVVQTIMTDDKGSFKFSNLPADEKLVFALDENDTRFANMKVIYIADEKGNIIREIVKSGGKFIFTVLPSEEKSLGRIYIDDPWLAVTKLKHDNLGGEITNAENLYYDYGKADLLPEAKKILDKIIYIMKEDPKLYVVLESHTDSRSSYGFNIRLSRLRAKTAVDYMIASGIPKERLRGKGFGELKPVNDCRDGKQCSEEQYAKNRRTEFRIQRRK
ncbi:MAG TPA: OmpA family protein [Bacteroidia bacterium]|jgi:outer membrane protein OmpA-like peptidoglycan-associated protein